MFTGPASVISAQLQRVVQVVLERHAKRSILVEERQVVLEEIRDVVFNECRVESVWRFLISARALKVP